MWKECGIPLCECRKSRSIIQQRHFHMQLVESPGCNGGYSKKINSRPPVCTFTILSVSSCDQEKVCFYASALVASLVTCPGLERQLCPALMAVKKDLRFRLTSVALRSDFVQLMVEQFAGKAGWS